MSLKFCVTCSKLASTLVSNLELELLMFVIYAFKAAWKEACETTGDVKLLIPGGTYLIGPLKFAGPCYVKATTDLSKYRFGAGWVEFGWVEGLTLTRGGTFDGQGAKAWPYNRPYWLVILKIIYVGKSSGFGIGDFGPRICTACLVMLHQKQKSSQTSKSSCETLFFFQNVKFVAMNRTDVRDITSLNSKYFHIALVECKNFKGSKIKVSAPANIPNTDGIHIERSSGVYFSRSHIGTRDDCTSVGQGNSQVTISSITCGPGHGIRCSVGSLERYRNEGDVREPVVRDSILTNTLNDIRIKTWANSPGGSVATNMTFENIVMNDVTNPIIIDQAYCPFTSCPAKLSDIYFKNIRGTSSSTVAVALECSKRMPCQNKPRKCSFGAVNVNVIRGETTHFLL
ncbi:hypothetical protein Patl1_35941 [Pistacia atlantica]|nr:hypothetical protein Patl1_35941 [Pistacia atlantica]